VILSSDRLNIAEIELFKVLTRWGEAQAKKSGGDLKSACKDLIKLIRFPLMQISELASTVSSSGLLESAQLVGLFSYVSVTDEKARSDPGFNTKERAGTNPWDAKKEGFGDVTAVGEWVKKKPGKWKKLYQASRDGWSGSKFHQLCDGKGPTVILVRLTNGYVFGAYTSVPWGTDGRLHTDRDAFIFSVTDGKGRPPMQLPIFQNFDGAVNHWSSGIQFGSNNDLHINLDSRSGSHSYLNQTYRLPSGYSNQQTFLAGIYTGWEFIEVSVYAIGDNIK